MLGDRPTDALWGIGSKTAARLGELGISTVRELAAADPRALATQLGPTTGPWLVQLARGLDPSPVTSSPYLARSRGRETTFQQDLNDWGEVRRQVTRLAGLVADDVAAEQRPVIRIVVKVRFAPFTTRTHGQSLGTPTAGRAAIEEAAQAALGQFSGRRPVRLLGVRAELDEPRPPAGQ